ncbi:MAG TPA: DALR anticodon-binding domain-containing protein, partial [Saprospiraceae bacterium]|nr:DALR anticodon-binding domain-containing protein [Saprospiraceae bacterium]
RKSECSDPAAVPEHVTASERNLIKTAVQYIGIVQEAGRTLDPSHLANYLYALAKDYHKYYHDIRILNAETESLKQWRLMLSSNVSKVLHHGMGLLGIQLPEKM